MKGIVGFSSERLNVRVEEEYLYLNIEGIFALKVSNETIWD